MTRRPALLLLAVLLGGLGASWVDAGHHAAEWAEGRASHRTSSAHDARGNGDQATTPCDDSSLRIDCAVCAGLHGAVVETGAVDHATEPEARERADAPSRAETRHAATLARGPPAAA